MVTVPMRSIMGGPLSFRSGWLRVLTLAALTWLLVSFGAAQARIYQWVDENGTLHIKDYPAAMYEGQGETGPDERIVPPKEVPEEAPLDPGVRPPSGVRDEAADILPTPEGPEAEPEPVHTSPEGQGSAAEPVEEIEQPSAPAPRPVPPQPGEQVLPDIQLEEIPQAVLQLMGLVTGTMVLIWLALALFFYFFLGLCLYCIARKLRLRYAWLAWIPVANIHTMVAAAGKPWWWTALILLTWVFPGLGVFLPAAAVVFLVLAVVVLVLFALIWMHICRRLRVNKWLGLLIYVPLAQWVLMAVLAFKREPVQARIPRGRILIRAVLVYVLLVAGLGAAIVYGALPFMMRQASEISLPAPPAPSTVRGPVRPTEGAAVPGGVESLSLAAYERLLDRADPLPEEGEPGVGAGPAALWFDTFWESDESPHLWVKVRLPDLPNLDLFKSARLRIDQVTNRFGENVYDPDSNFETEFFQELSFNSVPGPPAVLEAIRSVYLKPGVQERSISTITGTLEILLPVNIRSLALGKGDVGQSVESAGFVITLLKMDGQEVQLQVQGPMQRYLAVLALDGQGATVQPASSSWWSSGESLRTITYSFEQDIVRVQPLLAGQIATKSHPFALDAG
ncbi:MAG: DUF4124 domain-containing protein [Desulfovibrionales bacterium]